MSDSAQQTTTVVRTITVSDASCAQPWDRNTVYLANQLVSHKGDIYKAGWWTKGEEPGTTGQWGVWQLANNACQL